MKRYCFEYSVEGQINIAPNFICACAESKAEAYKASVEHLRSTTNIKTEVSTIHRPDVFDGSTPIMKIDDSCNDSIPVAEQDKQDQEAMQKMREQADEVFKAWQMKLPTESPKNILGIDVVTGNQILVMSILFGGMYLSAAKLSPTNQKYAAIAVLCVAAIMDYKSRNEDLGLRGKSLHIFSRVLYLMAAIMLAVALTYKKSEA